VLDKGKDRQGRDPYLCHLIPNFPDFASPEPYLSCKYPFFFTPQLRLQAAEHVRRPEDEALGPEQHDWERERRPSYGPGGPVITPPPLAPLSLAPH
jgi:hypothetical protein